MSASAAVDEFRDRRRTTAWQQPLPSLAWDSRFVWGLSAERLVWGFVALGLIARLARFLVGAPLWPDEAFLAANYLDRGYLDLMGPLEYHQVAPLLYLWIQLTIVKLLGFNELTLRLFSLLCGVGSLLLFRHLAARLLSGTAYVWSVAVFAVAYPLVRYSAEAKPYGSDVLVTLLLIVLAVRWWQAPAQRGWLWGLVVGTPLAVFLSYPAVFVAGGISLAVAVVLWRVRDYRAGLLWCLFNLTLVAGFGALFLLSAGAQAARETYMLDLWGHTFPPSGSASALLAWLIEKHTSDMLAYPLGGPRGASSFTFFWCAVGLAALVSRRHFPLLLLVAVPLVLNFAAAALHRYPYGGHIRFTLYAAPLICLLVGPGASLSLAFLIRSARAQQLVLRGFLATFVLILVVTMIGDQLKPYKTAEYLRTRDLARWFWHDLSVGGELVCMRTDLGLDFAPQAYEWCKSSLYLCHQRIYSARHSAGQPPKWDLISRDRPLRCVQYRHTRYPYDNEALEHWLAEMQSDYELVGRREFPEATCDDHDGTLSCNYLEVFEFVPRSGVSSMARPPSVRSVR
jgi:hypothetical protein